MKLIIRLALLSFFRLIIFSGILEAQSFTGTMNSFHKYDSDIGDDWPLDDKIFVSSSFNMGHMKFEDFFWINDSDYIKTEAPSSYLKLSLKSKLRGYEVSATDRLEPNVIARPEILVSRIIPYHIAVEYKLPGTIADGFLDQNGKPRVYTSSQKVSPNQYIRRQPSFERSLLIEYFE